jgi:colanic acid biosynthesis glycosyl transferase WcaI
MKILMLTQWFQPEPTFKGLPLARALRDRGHEVEVLTGFPNYPGGKLYPGYRVRPWSRETMDGIRVNRVPLYPSHDCSGLRRILNYLSFGASTALMGPWLVRKPDVIYTYNLISLSFASQLLRRLKGCKTILDVQDLWPEGVIGSGLLQNRALLGILNAWCRVAYFNADRLMVLSPGVKQSLVARGIPADKIEVVYNWCDETAMCIPDPDSALTRELGFRGRFNIVFAGTIGVVQRLDAVIECARRLQVRAPDVLFTFVGGGADVDRLKQKSQGLPNVQFLDRRPISVIGPIYAIADALLVHLKADPVFEITIPSKIQAYLFAGRPILCGVRGDASDLVRKAEAGLSFLPENPDSLAQAVLALRGMGAAERQWMGENGRAYYREHLTMSEGVRRMEMVFEAALATP